MQNINRETLEAYSDRYKYWEIRDDENVPLCDKEDGAEILEYVDSCAGLYSGLIVIFKGGKKVNLNIKKYWLPLKDNAKPPKGLVDTAEVKEKQASEPRQDTFNVKTLGFIQGLQKEVIGIQSQALEGQRQANNDIMNKHMEALTAQSQAQALIAQAQLDAQLEKQRLQTEFQQAKFDFELQKRDELAKIDKVREQAQRELEEAQKVKEKYELKLDRLEDKEETRKADRDIVMEGLWGVAGKALEKVAEKTGLPVDLGKGLQGFFTSDKDEEEEADTEEQETDEEEEAQEKATEPETPKKEGGINFDE